MITTTFLTLRKISELRPAKNSQIELKLQRTICPDAARNIFDEVGKNYFWNLDRADWSTVAWQRLLRRQSVKAFFICMTDGTPVGYLETDSHNKSMVEIVYFGLRPSYIGFGLGGAALTIAVRQLIHEYPLGIWLHTCTLDHPSSMGNYYARGFQFLKEEKSGSYFAAREIDELEVSRLASG